jgi:sec-independent protein translocase protein TatB
MFGLSFVEIAIVAVLALLLLGPDQLPSVAKTLGKGLRELRKASDDLKGTFETEMSKLEREVDLAQADKPAAPAWNTPAVAAAAPPVAAPEATPEGTVAPPPVPQWSAGGIPAPIGNVPLDQLRALASQDPGALRAMARQNAMPRDPGTARAAARFAAHAQQTAAEGVPPGLAALAAPVAAPEAPAASAPAPAPAAAPVIAVSPAPGAVDRKPDPS